VKIYKGMEEIEENIEVAEGIIEEVEVDIEVEVEVDRGRG